MRSNLLCPTCGHDLPRDLFAGQSKANCPACGSELDAARVRAAARSQLAAIPAMSGAEREDDEEGVTIKRRAEESEMDMTPMVDIVFQLLIFFMVTASFALQRSKEIPKPEENKPSTNASTPKDIESDPDFVVVRVDSLGTFHVLAVDWEQEEDAPSQQELIIKLKRARIPDSQGHVPFKMMVKAHGDALHGRVVMALDAGPIVGLREIQLQTTEEDE